MVLLDPQTLILLLLVGLAGVWDVTQRRIPNNLILVGLLLGIALQTQAGGFAGLGLSVLGAGCGLLVLLAPFALRLLGGGDVKLTMVCGAFLGWQGVLELTLLAHVLHGVVTLVLLVGRHLLQRLGRSPGRHALPPYAVAVAIAVVLLSSGAVQLLGR